MYGHHGTNYDNQVNTQRVFRCEPSVSRPCPAQRAASGTPVALEPCGQSAKTVWVVDSYDTIKGFRMVCSRTG